MSGAVASTHLVGQRDNKGTEGRDIMGTEKFVKRLRSGRLDVDDALLDEIGVHLTTLVTEGIANDRWVDIIQNEWRVEFLILGNVLVKYACGVSVNAKYTKK